MADTIEAFVAKLKNEGVEAGKKQAIEIRTDAEKEAEKILADARSEADRILDGARKERENMLSRTQTELKLASRDTVLRLREALGKALSAVLNQAAENKLSDVDFLGDVLHQLVTRYAEADIKGEHGFTINVEPELRQKLVDWAIAEIGRERVESTKHHMGLDLRGTLRDAGFEYNVTGATVEVTLESVVETLEQMVNPALRELIQPALEDVQDSQAAPDQAAGDAGSDE